MSWDDWDDWYDDWYDEDWDHEEPLDEDSPKHQKKAVRRRYGFQVGRWPQWYATAKARDKAMAARAKKYKQWNAQWPGIFPPRPVYKVER